MAADVMHMPYPHFKAAVRRGDLRFIRQHREAFTLNLADETEICRLIADQDPGGLEAESVLWIKRFARDCRGERRSDYGLIVRAFDVLSFDPETGGAQLRSLCAQRGLDR
jgi:hypothetical protein